MVLQALRVIQYLGENIGVKCYMVHSRLCTMQDLTLGLENAINLLKYKNVEFEGGVTSLSAAEQKVHDIMDLHWKYCAKTNVLVA